LAISAILAISSASASSVPLCFKGVVESRLETTMQFGLSESQQILKDTARKFFAGESPIAAVRKAMETGTAYDAALWTKLAEQGFTGIITPEEYGGMGLGKVELVLLMEEAGYALLPGPFFSTVALAGSVIDACATPEQKKKYLQRIAAGQARATVALVEAGGSWDTDNLKISAAGGKLNGTKLFVTDAAVADFIVVVASDDVFVVDAKAPGLHIEPMKGMDLARKIYAVEFKNIPAEKLGDPTGLAGALNVATAALCAEMTGGMQRTLELTVAYAKTRKQFGKPIGIFQAVQHLCADMYLETESSRSAAYYAAWALEENVPNAAASVSVAKMYASDAARNVGNRGIQVHGGMGFTWENDIHLYYRRAKASETMLGDGAFHRERIARMVIDGAAAGKKRQQTEQVALASK
jgi:alkylation response protein AidB-like acyl-CoA dehydrogenase